ncbi:MAG: glycine cleavage system protein GcvH [Candidatus Bathyarchaeia archaeon]
MVRVNGYEVQEGLYYHKEHLWVRLEDGLARVGISDYGQKALRDVVFVELPPEGSDVAQDEPCGTIESVKAVVDIVAPLSGTVEEANEALTERLELINQDPYGEGWLITLSPSNLEEELRNLLSLDEAVEFYKELAQEE